MVDLDYLRLSAPRKLLHNLGQFFAALPGRFVNLLKNGLFTINRFVKWLWTEIVDLVTTFRDGDWKTRISYVVMGFGSMARGQWGRGLLFFLFQTVFNLYMAPGWDLRTSGPCCPRTPPATATASDRCCSGRWSGPSSPRS